MKENILKEKISDIIYAITQNETGKGKFKDYEPHIKCGKIIFKKDNNNKNRISVYFEDGIERIKIDLHEYGLGYYSGLARIKNSIDEEEIVMDNFYIHNYFEFLFNNNDGIYEF